MHIQTHTQTYLFQKTCLKNGLAFETLCLNFFKIFEHTHTQTHTQTHKHKHTHTHAHTPTQTESEKVYFLIMQALSEVLKQVSKGNGSSMFAGSNMSVIYLTFKCAVLNHGLTGPSEQPLHNGWSHFRSVEASPLWNRAVLGNIVLLLSIKIPALNVFLPPNPNLF